MVTHQVGLLFPLVLAKKLAPPNIDDTLTFLPFVILLSFFFVFNLLFLPETTGATVGETSQSLQDEGWRVNFKKDESTKFTKS